MAKMTKLELEQLLAQRNAEVQQLRHRISVLEGQIALGAQPPAAKPAPRPVRVGGVMCNVVYERHGQATRKRYVPILGAQPPGAGLGPVPESRDECEFGDAEYQWRLQQAGL